MTTEMLRIALRGFVRRRPFLPFLIELVSGDRFLVTHPEAVDQVREFFVYRGPDRRQRVFGAAGVAQLLDPPTSPSQGTGG